MISFASTDTNHGLKLISNGTGSDDRPPHIQRSANMFFLGMLPAPEPAYDLALLLPPKSGPDRKIRRSFETVDACSAENRRRSSALLKMTTLRIPECSECIDGLNEQLDHCRADNWFESYIELGRVSALGMRELRRRSLGAILKFSSTNGNENARWISMSYPDWEFGLADDYWDERHFPVPTLFRSLLRIGGVMTAPGYLITYLHTLFDPNRKVFRLQYRGLCAGEKLHRFRNLTNILLDLQNRRLIEDYTGLHPETAAKRIKIGFIQSRISYSSFPV